MGKNLAKIGPESPSFAKTNKNKQKPCTSTIYRVFHFHKVTKNRLITVPLLRPTRKVVAEYVKQLTIKVMRVNYVCRASKARKTGLSPDLLLKKIMKKFFNPLTI